MPSPARPPLVDHWGALPFTRRHLPSDRTAAPSSGNPGTPRIFHINSFPHNLLVSVVAFFKGWSPSCSIRAPVPSSPARLARQTLPLSSFSKASSSFLSRRTKVKSVTSAFQRHKKGQEGLCLWCCETPNWVMFMSYFPPQGKCKPHAIAPRGWKCSAEALIQDLCFLPSWGHTAAIQSLSAAAAPWRICKSSFCSSPSHQTASFVAPEALLPSTTLSPNEAAQCRGIFVVGNST